jgi:mono/diheme cytochrome c family protein
MKIPKTLLLLGAILGLIIFSWISSCTHQAKTDNIPEICFERDVLPVFQNNCAISGCHDGTGESRLDLSSYVPISHAVEPGKPYSSKIYEAIITTAGENKMPPDQPLSLYNRMLIRLWIEQGANLTTCPDTSQHGNGGGGGGDDEYYNPRACFSRDILPVLLSRCSTSGCHDAITHREGYVFSSYSTTLKAVTPGFPSGSKLYQVIKMTGDDKMPPSGKPQLTTAEIDSIAAWIRYGALNEDCGETCDTINPVTFSSVIWPIMQTSCTGCHSGASPSGGVNLSSYAGVSTVAASGLLLNSLKGTGVTRMPPGSSFSACRIRQFEIWINNGYLNN